MIKRLLFIFSYFIISTIFSQTFTVNGTLWNHRTKAPVDSSIIIELFLKNDRLAETSTNSEGKFKFTLPDSLSGKELDFRFDQDDKKRRRKHNPGACSCDCIAPTYLAGDSYKKSFKIDSTKEFVLDYPLTPADICPYFPAVFFDKNKLQPLNLPIDEIDSTSTICRMYYFLVCYNKWVIEISGHCSPDEKHKQCLSLKRAQCVKDTLVKMGINPKRLITKAYADTRPAELKDENGSVIGLRFYEEWRRVGFTSLRMDFKE